jgi:exodeoxyribonuclease-3
MRIATFNINNIKRRLPNLLDWLNASKPDVVCLQELKCPQRDFPVAAVKEAGYSAVWRGEKTWNGVAILARGREPVLTSTALPGDAADNQARYIEAAVGGILVSCLYLPNGNPQPGPKFDYKLAWFRRLEKHASSLLEANIPAVLCGDFNVAPTPIDIYPTTSWDNDALIHPKSRAAFARLVDQGWTDALRKMHPDERIYTFWHYMRQRWERDAGLRLDHLLLSPPLAPRLEEAGVDRAVRGLENASDHAPVWVKLGPSAEARPRSARKERAVDAAAASEASPELAQTIEPAAGAELRTTKPRLTRAPKRMGTKGPLLVIDGDNFAHRSYHGLPKTIRRSDGSGAGAIVGFANFLLRLYDAEQPRAVIVGWDTLEAPTKRHEQFPAYQSGREFDDALIEQLKALPELVAACGFQNAKAPGFEADDFLAAAVAAEERKGGLVLVASGDRDTFQLASDRTRILYPIRAGEMARIGPEEVRKRYGVDPKQVPDFIALRGDPSDKLPGAAGVGPRGAADLLRRYGTLDGVLDAGRFPAQAEMLRLFRSIATMDASAPLPSLADQAPTWGRASELARSWALNQLAGRLSERA